MKKVQSLIVPSLAVLRLYLVRTLPYLCGLRCAAPRRNQGARELSRPPVCLALLPACIGMLLHKQLVGHLETDRLASGVAVSHSEQYPAMKVLVEKEKEAPLMCLLNVLVCVPNEDGPIRRPQVHDEDRPIPRAHSTLRRMSSR